MYTIRVEGLLVLSMKIPGSFICQKRGQIAAFTDDMEWDKWPWSGHRDPESAVHNFSGSDFLDDLRTSQILGECFLETGRGCLALPYHCCQRMAQEC